jgi:hypothetical protein
MINGQSLSAAVPIMADVSGHDDECLRFIERTSQTDPRRQGLSNLWLRRRAEYTALHSDARAAVRDVYVEQWEQ